MNDLNCFASPSQDLSINPSVGCSSLGSESSSRKLLATAFTTGNKSVEYRRKESARMTVLSRVLSGFAIANCQSQLVRGKSESGVTVVKPAAFAYSHENKRARLVGHYVCRDNMCPNCLRFKGLQLLNDLTMCDTAAVKAGFVPVMLTLTQRHNRTTDIRRSQDVMQKAFLKFSSGQRGYRALLEKAGLALSPSVKAVEVPFTKNGWHLHYHIAVWVDVEGFKSVDWSEMERVLAEKWCDCVVKVGGARPAVSAQKISFGKAGVNSLGAYIAKELVDSSYKEDVPNGKVNVMTMVDIAGGMATHESLTASEAESLIKRYHAAMKGTSKIKGVKNLCKFFGVTCESARHKIDELTFDDVTIYQFNEENKGDAALSLMKRYNLRPFFCELIEALFVEGFELEEVRALIAVEMERLLNGAYGAIPSVEQLVKEALAASANKAAILEEDFKQRKEIVLPRLMVKQAVGQLTDKEAESLELWSLNYLSYVAEMERRKELRRGVLSSNDDDFHYSMYL